MANHLFRILAPGWVMMILFLFLIGCVNGPGKAPEKVDLQFADDTLVKYNKQVVRDENQEIEDYISRHQWKMERTATGLRYHIYPAGKGPRAVKGKIVEISYSVSLLNGEKVYSSGKGEPRKFVIGKGQAESGVEEGILMLRKGDRAKFIVPSHLAFGLLGDLDKIPVRATLVYEIELLNISEK
jgi:FKBP-type peptidyl-prolyl cis-trans isomerase FkpA